MKTLSLLSLLAAGWLSISASADVIFEDNFDSEAAPGASILDYNSFGQWTVTDGTVDLISSGGFGISCAGGSGKCVDLDGSTGNAGVLTSSLLNLTAGNYALSFDISGNQRNGSSDSLLVTLSGFVNEVFELAGGDPWTSITRYFTLDSANSAAIAFSLSGGDNVGIILDNVVLQSLERVEVPEPSSFMLLMLGLLGLVLARRKAHQ